MKKISNQYPKYTYDDLVADVIKAGINPKRAYIFLAGLGVKGTEARWENSDGEWSAVEKAPVNDKDEVLLSGKAIFRYFDSSVLGVEL